MKKVSFILIITVLLIIIVTILYSSFNKEKRNSQNNIAINNSNNDYVIITNQTMESYNELEHDNQIKDYYNNLKERSIDKVSMHIKENTVTKTSATIVIIDQNKAPYDFGEAYIIEKNILGNWWIQLPLISDYVQEPFTGHGANGITEMKIEWFERYGELKKGKYRIVKFPNAENKIYAEFNIK